MSVARQIWRNGVVLLPIFAHVIIKIITWIFISVNCTAKHYAHFSTLRRFAYIVMGIRFHGIFVFRSP
uniref:Uncharacterized protein n=1 Tax=Ixodes ricinus TaxID=34613 RepID=A0A6B0TSW4_IXORI